MIMEGVPPKELSANNRHGQKGYVVSSIVSKVKEPYVYQARERWHGPPLDGDLEASWIIVWPKGRRGRYDVDSLASLLKPIQDCLQGICYHNDSQIKREIYEQAKDDTGTWPDGCVVLTISEYHEHPVIE